MERSRSSLAPRGAFALSTPHHAGRVALAAVVDLASRLAVPFTVLALAWGKSDTALTAAVATSGLAVARGLVAGWVAEGEAVELHGRILDAIDRRSVLELRGRPDDQNVTMLLDAVVLTADLRAAVVPRLLADLVGLLLVAAGVAVRLGWAWLVGGAAVGAAAAAVVVAGQLRIRRSQQAGWRAFAKVARDIGVALDGATELRAHRRQAAFTREALERVRLMARHRRHVATTSALLGMLPFAIVLLAATIPFRATLEQLSGSLDVARAAELGVFGATGLVLCLGVARGVEGFMRSAPHRRTLTQLLDVSPSVAAIEPTSVAVADAEIVLDRFRVRYPGADVDTPAELSFRWTPGVGVCLSGDNGSGKTSLVLALLGLVEPTSGQILYDGIPASSLDWDTLAGRVIYVPQAPFLAEGETVGWHLRLFAPWAADDASLASALRKVGLYDVLSAHDTPEPLDVLAGELSGGERRRLQLARCFLHPEAESPDLIVLDEPEAGLDRRGRQEIRSLVAALARRSRVLLVAHDHRVVPEGFAELSCFRGDDRSDGESTDDPPRGSTPPT